MSYSRVTPTPGNANPYQNFLNRLQEDENPNFLWYILTIMEKHSYAQQVDLFKAVRERLEKKYHLNPLNPWKSEQN